jgi:hypothetical protein
VKTWSQLAGQIKLQTASTAAVYVLSTDFKIDGGQTLSLGSISPLVRKFDNDDDGGIQLYGLTISIVGQGANVVLDASHLNTHPKNRQLFYTAGNCNLTLAGLILQNAHIDIPQGQGYGAAILQNGGLVTATNCTFRDNFVAGTLSGCGAAIAVFDGFLSLNNCVFVNNTATQSAIAPVGGALYVQHGYSATITACTFTPSASTSMGHNGIYRDTRAAAATITFLCPEGTTGSPVVMSSQVMSTSELPPTKAVVHCN